MIGIIGAMKNEISFIKDSIENCCVKEISNFKFFIGNIYKHKVVLVQSGIGKVASGLIIGVMISNFPELKKIINVGTCGGVLGRSKCLDVIIGSSFSYADVFVPNYQFGQIPHMPQLFYPDQEILQLKLDNVLYGLILSGDRFFTSIEEIDNLNSKFKNDFLALDMESCAFAQACYTQSIPFTAIRVISDCVGNNEQEKQFRNNLERGCILLKDTVLEMLKLL